MPRQVAGTEFDILRRPFPARAALLAYGARRCADCRAITPLADFVTWLGVEVPWCWGCRVEFVERRGYERPLPVRQCALWADGLFND